MRTLIILMGFWMSALAMNGGYPSHLALDRYHGKAQDLMENPAMLREFNDYLQGLGKTLGQALTALTKSGYRDPAAIELIRKIIDNADKLPWNKFPSRESFPNCEDADYSRALRNFETFKRSLNLVTKQILGEWVTEVEEVFDSEEGRLGVPVHDVNRDEATALGLLEMRHASIHESSSMGHVSALDGSSNNAGTSHPQIRGSGSRRRKGSASRSYY
ncbi:hypothetical protein SeMB42_g03490 [Synchytrium endobioticum]|uniref:Uncharacterized protein n=1 Tax=Synchytrium endobioticum TaxID=286115 RepID=A0A507D6E0_9FUNG|nr:hypothetical protein SeMB42_g03490 [Synchytrium endobioticum]TPX50267.1 hypothetical protein SeLEV6574_g00990 [Synchytrium endobioticum]